LSLLFGGVAAKFMDVMYVFIFCAAFEFVIGVYFTIDEKIKEDKKRQGQFSDIFIKEQVRY
jgi:hypothetical protein